MLERPDEPGLPSSRISDAERNQVIELLRHHTGAGYITLDEFSDRVEQVFSAATRADLELVTMDLPGVAQAVPEERRRRSTQWAVGIMSGHKSAGRWRPAEEVTALAIMGGVELDLRQAEIDGPEIIITAIAIMGGIEIIVPEGIAVDASVIPFMGGFENKLKDVPRMPGQPLIRIKGLALMGGVTVRNKRPRMKESVERLVEGSLDAAAERIERSQERMQERMRRQQERIERHQRHTQRQVPGPRPPAMPAPPAPAALPGRYEPSEIERVIQSAQKAASEAVMEAAGGWREKLRSHAAPDGTVTILFTDMESYTELTVRLGDLKANEVLNAHNVIVREQLAAHGGYEVKCQGDSFMVAFAGASRALRCAVAIQRAFEDYCEKHPDQPIRVHMGLHTGEVIREADDFIGRTVILASRIASAAKGGEILVSSLLKELTDSTGEFVFDDVRETELKGLGAPQRLYPVLWST